MTINDALLSVYPDQIVSEPIKLGTKLSIMTDHNSMWRDWQTFESMRRRSTAHATLVPVVHATL